MRTGRTFNGTRPLAHGIEICPIMPKAVALEHLEMPPLTKASCALTISVLDVREQGNARKRRRSVGRRRNRCVGKRRSVSGGLES